MKKVAMLLVAVPSLALAGGNHNTTVNEQNTVVVVNAPAGPQGPQGEQGVMGLKGEKGDAGQDYDGSHRLTANFGADVRWYDWKHVSLHSGYRGDVNHGNHTVDIAVVTFKLGKSYEEREIEKLKLEIEKLTNTHYPIEADLTNGSMPPIHSTIRGSK